MKVYLKEDQFDAAIILRHSRDDTFYSMDWEDNWIDFLIQERDVGDTDEDVLDEFVEQRDKAIACHYKFYPPCLEA